MTLRSIGDRQLKPIGLGCMSLSHGYGTPPSEADSTALLNRALDLGHDHLDTARLYGLGRNETLIGKALKHRRQEFFLASKCGIIIDGPKRRIDCRPETIRDAVETSLTQLQTDFIDLYYLHRRDFETPIEDSVGALADLIKAGKLAVGGNVGAAVDAPGLLSGRFDAELITPRKGEADVVVTSPLIPKLPVQVASRSPHTSICFQYDAVRIACRHCNNLDASSNHC